MNLPDDPTEAQLQRLVAVGPEEASKAIVAELRSALTNALDFIEAQEWAGWNHDGYDPGDGYCLSCGAEKGREHEADCNWLACMRDGGRR